MSSWSHTLLFNKPYGVLSCFTDSRGRPTLSQFISVPLVYPAGRLDCDSEGLLVLTSDGELSHRLTDPRYKLPKTYLVQVERLPDETALAKLRDGMMIQRRQTRQAAVELLNDAPNVWPRSTPIRFRKSVPTGWLKITIREGVNRQIRRMTAAVGHPTLRIVRLAIGPLTVEGLEPGHWRRLHPQEWSQLKAALFKAKA